MVVVMVYLEERKGMAREETGWLGSAPSATVGALGSLSKDFSEQRIFSVLVDVVNADVPA